MRATAATPASISSHAEPAAATSFLTPSNMPEEISG